MTSIKRQALRIDDPLTPSGDEPTVAVDQAPGKPKRRASATAREPKRGTSSAAARTSATLPKYPRPAPAGEGLWREWSGLTGVGSFRLPHELLAELSDTARELGLPVGLMATAAITQLLDQPSEEIAALVDRADDARIQGRRRARRQVPKRTDS